MPSKQMQHMPSTEQRLLSSTIRLFNQHGVSVTTEAICVDAGVGKGTLFNCFKSKDNLLYQAYLHCHYHAREITETGIDWDNSVEAVVKQLLRQSIRWGIEFPHEVLYVCNYYREMHTDVLSVDVRSKVKGFIDDERIYPRLRALVPASFPSNYLSVMINNQQFQLCQYLAEHPEHRDDHLFIEHVIEWIWRSVDLLRSIG